MSKNIDPAAIKGGQIWQQDHGSCFRRYVTIDPVYVADRMFRLLSDPREQGSTICTVATSKTFFSAEELAAHFGRFGYANKGQLNDLMEQEWSDAYDDGRRAHG